MTNEQHTNTIYYKTTTSWQLGDERRVTNAKRKETKRKKRVQDSRKTMTKTETEKNYSQTNRSEHHPAEDIPRCAYTIATVSIDSLPADLITNVAENPPDADVQHSIFSYSITHKIQHLPSKTPFNAASPILCCAHASPVQTMTFHLFYNSGP